MGALHGHVQLGIDAVGAVTVPSSTSSTRGGAGSVLSSAGSERPGHQPVAQHRLGADVVGRRPPLLAQCHQPMVQLQRVAELRAVQAPTNLTTGSAHGQLSTTRPLLLRWRNVSQSAERQPSATAQ